MRMTLKIIILYIIGFLCVALFIYIDNSQELNDFLIKADRFRTDWGFGFYAIVGLLKIVSLVSGVTIPLILTLKLIKQKYRKSVKTLLILYGLFLPIQVFSQIGSDKSGEITSGNWILFKDSISNGKVTIITDSYDRINFSDDGTYKRTIKFKDGIIIETGLWNYNTTDNEITLTNRVRDYLHEGKKVTYDFSQWPERIINVDKNQFIIQFTTDANKNNEIFQIYQFYKRIQ